MPYQMDPLCAAVEIAWRRGLVVVVAAGNGGPNSGTVDSPGIDPYVITVGATDDRATNTIDDDILGFFSSWGSSNSATSKPDVVAPGRRIISLRDPGSYLDLTYPDHITLAQNGATYFRLTGTSMATAVASGAAALILQQQPGLSPDNIKGLLVGTAQPYGGSSGVSPPDPSANGGGLIDALAAVYSGARPTANHGFRAANGLAITLYPILYGQRLAWKNPTYDGIDWSNVNWTNLAWDTVAWDNLAWDNFDWTNLAWDNLAWDTMSWGNLAWDNLAWDNLAWDTTRPD